MADIQHSVITDPNIHEPKDISTAAANATYVSDGGGSGSWLPVDYPVSADFILEARSEVTQNPTGLDAPLQLTLGPAQTVTGATLDTAGNITVTEDGTYVVVFVLRLSRATNTGISYLGFRWLVNGVMQGKPSAITIDAAANAIPFSFTTSVSLLANDVITVEIIRDSAGADDGGVTPLNFAVADWETAASAVAIIYKNKAAL